MSRFENTNLKMKLGDILKTFTTSTYETPMNMESMIADAVPIWNILNITEEEYYIKYPPIDSSGNVIPNQKIDDQVVQEE